MSNDKHHEHNQLNVADEERLVNLARKSIEDSLQDIDGETLSQLRQARTAALQQLEHKSTWFGLTKNQWIPVGGFALVTTLAVSLLINQSSLDHEQTNTPLASTNSKGSQNNVANEENEIFATNDAWEEDEEMLDELDFVTWLAIDEESAG